MRRLTYVILALGLILAMSVETQVPAAAQAGKTPLKHIIVVYLENWSFGADLAIIAQTAVQVVRPPKTAY